MTKNNDKAPDSFTGLVLETSAACGLRCPLCFLRSYTERPKPALMPLEVVEAVAPYLAGLDSIDLTGWGEPLQNPALFDIMRLIRRTFSGRITMTTNGQLLTPDAMKKLIRFGLDTVCVSVDAAGERSYQAARPGGDFGKLRKAMEEFASLTHLSGAGKPHLFATFLLRRDALAELADFVSLVAGHGFEGVVFQQLTGIFTEAGLDQATHSAYYGGAFDEQRLAEALMRARKKAPEGFVIVGPEKIGAERTGNCGGFDVSRPFITASGLCSVCCAMAYPCALYRRDGELERTEAMTFGDVRTRPLPEIWSDPAYVRARAEIRSGDVPWACGDCIALYMRAGEVWTAGGGRREEN
jgi:MoaA/NifB/PqqE/SkfB family radical SAM enzyme